jgi:hypothetical protein
MMVFFFYYEWFDIFDMDNRKILNRYEDELANTLNVPVKVKSCRGESLGYVLQN